MYVSFGHCCNGSEGIVFRSDGGPESVPSVAFFVRGSLAQTDGGNMRIFLNIVGVLLVLFGSIWILQGMNVLLGSPMSGQSRWAVRGGFLVFAGLADLVWANRKQKSAA